MSKFINPFTDVGFKRIFGQHHRGTVPLCYITWGQTPCEQLTEQREPSYHTGTDPV
ncbi:MAG: hypothetical protein IJP74_10230 [Prevotella sp.]|nr:hypothetical protein [Prevotella sp.]